MSQDEQYGVSLALCLMSAFFAAVIAGYKNRSMFWWSFCSLFVPVLLIPLAFLSKKRDGVGVTIRGSERSLGAQVLA